MVPTIRNRVVSSAIVVLLFGALSAVMSAPAKAVAADPQYGAIAFAKVSPNLSSSIAPSYYDADPSDLGPFYTASEGISDNGLTSAAAAAPCPAVGVCIVPALVPDSQGQGTASADLASGTLRVYAFADGRSFDSGAYLPLLQSEAFAGFRDILTVLEDGVLRFELHITGTDTVDPRDGGTADYINFLINGAAARTIDGQGLASSDGVTGFGCGGGDPLVTLCDVDLLVDVPVITGDQLVFSLLLGVVVQDGTADYSHTLSLTATGVGFTSASGVFLTQVAPPSGVPEPSTWAMVLLGFGGIGFTMRARRRASAIMKRA